MFQLGEVESLLSYVKLCIGFGLKLRLGLGSSWMKRKKCRYRKLGSPMFEQHGRLIVVWTLSRGRDEITQRGS